MKGHDEMNPANYSIPKTMSAYAAIAPGKIEKITLPVPEPDDFEVLVQHEGCVFCNTTDKMIVENLFATPDYPVVFGHESFGRVVKIGKHVTKYRLGDRVICSNAIVKGRDRTYFSTWGGFAEFGIAGDLQAFLSHGGILDDANRYRQRYDANCVIPSDFSPEKACLAFPLAETASAVAQVGDLTGKTVVVIGTGIVGYFFTYFAKQFGANRVITLGRRQFRLEIARQVGADDTFLDVALATQSILAEGGADVAFECSGNYRVLEQGLPYLKKGGIFAVYAVPHEPYVFNLSRCPRNFTYQRIDPEVPKALDFVCDLLRKDQVPVELFLTHKWTFDQVPEAYEQVRKGEVIKGLVRINE